MKNIILNFEDLPEGEIFSISNCEELTLIIYEDRKLNLRKGDEFGRIIRNGKEMLLATKHFTSEESKEKSGLQAELYSCYIDRE
ncbi:hypothetical protein [Sebaldella sp. S0638]|uniref:hypothetical protein n=1 Tax=Sebaldella sp. S0638 TaxID=2957809 RepID=UPI0020A0C4D4|nr:hypothetical protein [Sebaldella sp. S0638]MCP1223078.1 hypothetical protein [Sebaldella sp. S0638]